jgi:hypothetical protein
MPDTNVLVTGFLGTGSVGEVVATTAYPGPLSIRRPHR